jgi:hypothetical protein
MPDAGATFRRLADCFPGFCWIVSLAQGQPRLVYASPTAETFWKWCHQKIQSDIRKLPEIINPEDFPKMSQAWAWLLTGEKFSGECRLLGPSGQVHHITVQAGPLDPENFPSYMNAGFCLDHATCLLRRQV